MRIEDPTSAPQGKSFQHYHVSVRIVHSEPKVKLLGVEVLTNKMFAVTVVGRQGRPPGDYITRVMLTLLLTLPLILPCSAQSFQQLLLRKSCSRFRYLGRDPYVDEVQSIFDFTNYGYGGNKTGVGDIEEFEQQLT